MSILEQYDQVCRWWRPLPWLERCLRARRCRFREMHCLAPQTHSGTVQCGFPFPSIIVVALTSSLVVILIREVAIWRSIHRLYNRTKNTGLSAEKRNQSSETVKFPFGVFKISPPNKPFAECNCINANIFFNFTVIEGISTWYGAEDINIRLYLPWRWFRDDY